MAGEYQVDDQEGIYFVTSTVHQWADVFTLLSDIFRRECRTTDLPDLQSGLQHPD